MNEKKRKRKNRTDESKENERKKLDHGTKEKEMKERISKWNPRKKTRKKRLRVK